MKIYTCSINFNSLFKSYYTKQGAISEVEMDFQNNIKIKMFSGLWFLNLWVKLNLFHSTVDIPYRNIHKYQALQNIMSESKGRSYPAVQKKCCNHCSQKSLSLMLWSFFLMYWLQKRRKCSISRCNYPKQGTPQIIEVVDSEFADSKIYSFYSFNLIAKQKPNDWS